jgi:hypothetical protein
MNPFWLLARLAAGATVIGIGGLFYLTHKALARPDDLIAGAAHFRRGTEEFCKGLSTVVFGRPERPSEKAAKEREASRIPIE